MQKIETPPLTWNVPRFKDPESLQHAEISSLALGLYKAGRNLITMYPGYVDEFTQQDLPH